MGQQPHIIRKQILRVQVGSAEEAQRLLPRLSEIASRQIPTILERCLDEASTEERIERIDRLEVDIGRLRLESLEREVAGGLAQHLPIALAGALKAARSAVARTHASAAAPPPASSLEVIGFFARTGRLPWWRSGWREMSLAVAVRQAADEDAAALANLLRSLAHDGVPFERLVRHLDDGLLASLCVRLAPATDVSASLLALLPVAPATAGFARAWLRQIFWRETVRATAPGPTADATPMWRAALVGIAAACGTTFASLIVDLHEAAARGAPGGLAAMLQRLRDEVPGSTRKAATRPSPGPRPEGAAWISLAERLTQALRLQIEAGGPLAPLFAAVLQEADRLPEHRIDECLAAIELLESPTAIDGSDGTQLAAVRMLLRIFVQARLLAMDALQPHLARFDAAALPAPETAAVSPDGRRTPPSPSPRWSDEADACYIENAGLVLLWPFLPRFFSTLGLIVENDRFRDALAQHRAAAALHAVATGEAEPPEYWLPLNKALCGIALDAPHLLAEPLTDGELHECEVLLAAAMAHAAVLGDLSIDALRRTYLLRTGALSTRDGAWLLRVERQSGDDALDRLPWTMEWVKLPWMLAPMRIEW